MNLKNDPENCMPTYTISKEDLEKMYPTSRILSDLPLSIRMPHYMKPLIDKAKLKVKKWAMT